MSRQIIPLKSLRMNFSRAMLVCKAKHLLSLRYYEGPNALCSFFITSTEENCWNFVILIQNSIEDHQEKDDIEPVISSISSWNAVHKGGVEFNESLQTYAYKLHSSVVVRSRKIPSKADTNDASGFPNWVC